MTDEELLRERLMKSFKDFESICSRCGSCCGAYDGDACSNLVNAGGGTYSCKNYEGRLGLQQTVSGKIFTCVPIRELLKEGQLRPECAYNIRGRARTNG